MANLSKKRRGAKSRKKAAVKAKPAPVAELSYGATESEAATAIPECADMLPEPPAPGIVEEVPTIIVDAMPDETVQPSAPKPATPAARGVRRWFGRLFARAYGVR